ncbi:unnamed protein product [Lepidochelys olivacea]
MRASLAVCILAALLATGACLKCEVCDGPGTSCTGDLQTCPAGEDICGIARTEVTWGAGMKTPTILKGCVTSSQCRSSPISVNFGNGMEITMHFTCCMGDACRTSTVTAATTSRAAGMTSTTTTSGTAGAAPGPAGFLLPAFAGLLLLELLS